jgi:hypothetical protein
LKVTCEQCAVGHNVEPPPWIVASGKPFDFQCPACGHRQKVRPTVGIELAPGAEGLGELDAGTVVEEAYNLRSKVTQPRRSSAPKPALEDDPFAGGPEASYLQALEQADATIVDAPQWRGEVSRRVDESIVLRQGEEEFAVPDLATLQRWIMERRVEPGDELSEGTGGWMLAGDRPDLSVFFAAVQQLDAIDRRVLREGVGPERGPRAGSIGGTDAVPVAPPDEDDEGDPTVESLAVPTEEVPLPRPGGAMAPPPLEVMPTSLGADATLVGDDEGAPTELAPTVVRSGPTSEVRTAPPPPAERPSRRVSSSAVSGLSGLLVGFVVAVVVAVTVWAAVLQPEESVAPVMLPPPRMAPPQAAPQELIQPTNVEGLLTEATDALDRKNPGSAADLARAALIREPDNARAHMTLGLSLHALGRYAESVEHLCAVGDKLGAAEQARARQLLTEQRQTCPDAP